MNRTNLNDMVTKEIEVDDEALLAVMIHEASHQLVKESVVLKGATVSLPDENWISTPTIITRLGSIGAYYNPELSNKFWNSMCQQHPAAGSIVSEVKGALNTGVLAALMDRLDQAGYVSTFNRQSNLFTIMFTARNEALVDVQKDFKNQQRLDWVNMKDEFVNPHGGWVEKSFNCARELTWTFPVN